MPCILLVGLVLELAGLVAIGVMFGDVLDARWCAALAGFLPAIGSAVSVVGVWRARGTGRRLPEALFAFAISGTAFLAAAAALLREHYDGSLPPFAVALVAQAIGWCCLVAVGRRRIWRCLAAIAFALLVVFVQVLVPLAACADAFALGIADAVLMSDVETAEELASHRAAVHDEGRQLATRHATVITASGAAALVLLLALWRRARPDRPLNPRACRPRRRCCAS
jgi:hypothetical protein